MRHDAAAESGQPVARATRTRSGILQFRQSDTSSPTFANDRRGLFVFLHEHLSFMLVQKFRVRDRIADVVETHDLWLKPQATARRCSAANRRARKRGDVSCEGAHWCAGARISSLVTPTLFAPFRFIPAGHGIDSTPVQIVFAFSDEPME